MCVLGKCTLIQWRLSISPGCQGLGDRENRNVPVRGTSEKRDRGKEGRREREEKRREEG